jgi:hypothetical protein
MNKQDLQRVVDEERAKEEAQREFTHEMRTLLERIDERVYQTPTSTTREVLTDCSIVIRAILDGKMIKADAFNLSKR